MNTDGFALEALVDTNDAQTLRALQELLQTDPAQLGKGKDVQKAYGPYDSLRVACAWKINHPIRHDMYDSGLKRVQKDMNALGSKLVNVVNVPGLPAKTATASHDFGSRETPTRPFYYTAPTRKSCSTSSRRVSTSAIRAPMLAAPLARASILRRTWARPTST